MPRHGKADLRCLGVSSSQDSVHLQQQVDLLVLTHLEVPQPLSEGLQPGWEDRRPSPVDLPLGWAALQRDLEVLQQEWVGLRLEWAVRRWA